MKGAATEDLFDEARPVDRAIGGNERCIDGDDVDVAQTRQLGIALADGELDEAQLAVFNLGQGVGS